LIRVCFERFVGQLQRLYQLSDVGSQIFSIFNIDFISLSTVSTVLNFAEVKTREHGKRLIIPG